MSSPRFIQIHTLTSYPATLLNRDDAGFAKRLPFGGATRTRVSSQCLKYHWRNFEGEHAIYGMDVPRSLRSRETFRRRVVEPLLESGYPARLVWPFARAVQERILSDKPLSKSDFAKLANPSEKTKLEDELKSSQVTIFGEPEVRYIRQLIAETIDGLKDEMNGLWENGAEPMTEDQIQRAHEAMQAIGKADLKKNLKGLKLASGLDAAMFGRMATSDVLARGDAAVHVAHAFTTHQEESESDYFAAIDELVARSGEGELGSGHINSQELTSGLFYGYVVVDVPLLIANIEGVSRSDWQSADAGLAADVLKRLVNIVATVSPGAKVGSTAPHAYAQCMFVEAGSAQPRTLANSFQQPVSLNSLGVLANSYASMAKYPREMDAMYGVSTERRLAGVGPIEPLVEAAGVESTSSVPEIAEWTAASIRGGA